jgi:hypothetical protein
MKGMLTNHSPTFGSSGVALLAMAATVGIYSGQGWGWVWGSGLTLAFLVLVFVSNSLVLIGLKSVRGTTTARWVIFAIFMLAIGVAQTEICSTGNVCSSL